MRNKIHCYGFAFEGKMAFIDGEQKEEACSQSFPIFHDKMQKIKKFQNFPVLTCSKKKKYDIKIMSFVTNTGYGQRANPLPYPVFLY